MQQAKTWHAVEFEIEEAEQEFACWLMMQLGSIGCQIQQLTESKALVSAIFQETSRDQLIDVQAKFKEYGLNNQLKDLRIRNIPEEDWLVKWKENLRPTRVGKNFLISPPWFAEELAEEINSKASNTCVIYIEPGMAFGTGLHATTQYCLQALENNIQSNKQSIDILDIGTGSGILAIASAKLNPQARIIACDIDPVCIKVAQQNIELNNVSKNVVIKGGSTETCKSLSFDCIVANISYEDISRLLLEFLRLLRPEGRLILAGILGEKLKLLEQNIESYPLKVIDTQLNGEWVGVTMQRIGVVIKAQASS